MKKINWDYLASVLIILAASSFLSGLLAEFIIRMYNISNGYYYERIIPSHVMSTIYFIFLVPIYIFLFKQASIYIPALKNFSFVDSKIKSKKIGGLVRKVSFFILLPLTISVAAGYITIYGGTLYSNIYSKIFPPPPPDLVSNYRSFIFSQDIIYAELYDEIAGQLGVVKSEEALKLLNDMYIYQYDRNKNIIPSETIYLLETEKKEDRKYKGSSVLYSISLYENRSIEVFLELLGPVPT